MAMGMALASSPPARTSCRVRVMAESMAKIWIRQSASTPSSSCLSEMACMYFCTPSEAA